MRLEPLNGCNVGPAPPEPLNTAPPEPVRGVGVSEKALVDVQPEADPAPPVRMNWVLIRDESVMNWVLIRDAAAAPAAKPAE